MQRPPRAGKQVPIFSNPNEQKLWRALAFAGNAPVRGATGAGIGAGMGLAQEALGHAVAPDVIGAPNTKAWASPQGLLPMAAMSALLGHGADERASYAKALADRAKSMRKARRAEPPKEPVPESIAGAPPAGTPTQRTPATRSELAKARKMLLSIGKTPEEADAIIAADQADHAVLENNEPTGMPGGAAHTGHRPVQPAEGSPDSIPNEDAPVGGDRVNRNPTYTPNPSGIRGTAGADDDSRPTETSIPAAPAPLPRAARNRVVTNLTDLSKRQTRYMGNKRENLQKNATFLADHVAPAARDVGTIYDGYARGGTYGLSLALSDVAPKVRRVVVNEVDPVRADRFKSAAEHGARALDAWVTDPALRELSDALRPLVGKSSSPASAAIDAYLGKGSADGKYDAFYTMAQRHGPLSRESAAALRALQDVMFSGRTADWERLMATARTDAQRIHDLVAEASKRGIEVKLTSHDALGPDALQEVRGQPGKTLVVLDPPYHETASGTYSSGGASHDFASRGFLDANVAAARAMGHGNVVLYHNKATPEVETGFRRAFDGKVSTHKWDRGKNQREFIGVHNGTDESGDVGVRSGEREAAVKSRETGDTGRVLRATGGDTRGRADTRPTGDVSGGRHQPAAAEAESEQLAPHGEAPKQARVPERAHPKPVEEVSEQDLSPADQALVQQTRARASEARDNRTAESTMEQESRERGEREAGELGLRGAVEEAVGRERMARIHFVHDEAGLPAKVRKRGTRIKQGNVRYGLHTPEGDTYIFTEHANTPARAIWTAWHENGHEAIQRIVANHPDVKVGTMTASTAHRRARELFLQNPTVRKLAEVIGRKRDTTDLPRMAEEVMAELHAARETGDWDEIKRKYDLDVPESMRAGVGRAMDNFVRRIKAILNAVYRRITHHTDAPYTDADVVDFLDAMHEVGKGERGDARTRLDEAQNDAHLNDDVTPYYSEEPSDETGTRRVGEGEHGPIFEAPNYQSAVDTLLHAKTGEVRDALYHPDIGHADLIYGKAGTPSDEYADGYGLAKIIAKHPEVDVRALENELLSAPKAKFAGNTAEFDTPRYRMVFKRDWKGQKKNWLLTAFDPKIKPVADSTRIGAAVSGGEARSSKATDSNNIPRSDDYDLASEEPQDRADVLGHGAGGPAIEPAPEPDVELPPRAPGESPKAWHARIMRENRVKLSDRLKATAGFGSPSEWDRMRKIGRAGMKGMWAKNAREADKLGRQFAVAMKVFDKAGEAANRQAIHQWETGQEVTSAPHRIFFKAMDAEFKRRIDAIRDVAPGTLEHVIENYFPHLWEDPIKARKWYQSVFGKRPLEGSKSFLKQRTHVTLEDGIKAHLKPVSTNPVDLVLGKMAEMDRFLNMHRFRKDLQQRGWLKEMEPGQRVPYGLSSLRKVRTKRNRACERA